MYEFTCFNHILSDKITLEFGKKEFIGKIENEKEYGASMDG